MAYQLTIRAVRGLVCRTALMPPRRSTSFLAPSTCISLTLVLPLPNCESWRMSCGRQVNKKGESHLYSC